ncbi:unnamed protein product [Linum trigynum]|uniref:Integrase catalytic domain-containing protein n=1 Tax=Linum trigynum TaxID=586398 RepID=A0AAV2GRT1_9ROSI
MSGEDHSSFTGETPPSKSSGSGGSGSHLDALSPLFIHQSDSTGHLHVSSLLTPTNYSEWALEMTDALVTKHKLGFVDGSTPRPAAGVAELGQWIRCDALVKGWLRTAMDPEVRSSVMHAKTAQEIWEDLRDRFSKGNLTRVYELRRHISHLQQEKQTVSGFYTQLRKNWEETQSILPPPLCACGRRSRDQNESLRLLDFLLGLDDSFATVRSQILSMTPVPTLPEAFRIVHNDEQQRLLTQSRKVAPEAAAFASRSEPEKRGGDQRDQRGGRDGGSSARDRSSSDRDRDRPVCSHCQKVGHVRETCYELIGWPPRDKTGDRGERGERGTSRRGRGREGSRSREPHASQAAADSSPASGFTAQQLDQLKQLFGHSFVGPSEPISNMAGTFSSSFESEWLIDSGCNEHITMDDSVFSSYESDMPSAPVRIPDGSSIPVKRIGSVKLDAGLSLGRVLHVPEFRCNLLSVSRLCQEHNVALIFLGDFCVIQDLDSKNVIGKGEIREGLYYLRLFGCRTARAHAVVKNGVISAGLWHARLGHPSQAKMELLGRTIPFSHSPHAVCHPCSRAKQVRTPFPIRSIRTTACFELLHMDIWGGYQTASFSGAHYFLTIVDDFSRAVWVYLLRFKSEVCRYVQMFCQLVATQFGCQVRRIQADNGLEFQSAALQRYYEQHGIVLHTSCTDTPQQNGVVERKHRHLLDTARALRFQASLPIRFWGCRHHILSGTFMLVIYIHKQLIVASQ